MIKGFLKTTLFLLLAVPFSTAQNAAAEQKPEKKSPTVSICREVPFGIETITKCSYAPPFLRSFLGSEPDSWVIGLHSSGGVFGDHFSMWVNSEGHQVCSVNDDNFTIGDIDVRRFRQVTTLVSGVAFAPRNNFVQAPARIQACNDCSDLSLVRFWRDNGSFQMSQLSLAENTSVVADLYDAIAALPKCSD